MELLDPKLDVVFKLLFADPANERLLVSLLSAVLRPAVPIARVKVLNPELPKDLVLDRGVRLDVLVELADGARVDVEMECDGQRGHGARWLYHWARIFGGTLRRGDEYADLKPVVCIVFLAAKSERFHARYSVREERDGSLLSHVLGIHVIGLPAVERAASEQEPPELERWARFLRLDEASALDSLARESPIMAAAKHALELLSLEPSAQRIAEMRREAELMRRLDRAEQRAEGRAEADAAARRVRADALRGSIVRASALLGLTLDDTQRAQFESSDDEQLQTLLDSLLETGAWPKEP